MVLHEIIFNNTRNNILFLFLSIGVLEILEAQKIGWVFFCCQKEIKT